jgi:Tfp pilus assembly protein PilZ
LQSAVPARDSVPSAGDYEQHVKDAVLQLATDVPLIRLGTLAVVANTATYSLASDFLFLIELEGLASTDNLIISDSGLIPMPREWEETFTIEGTEITFDPTPTYTLSRDYRYAALYELTGSDPDETYARMNQNGARFALLYAQYLAVMQQANAVAGDGWRYQIGDEMVDKSNQGRGMASQAQGLLTQYNALGM